MAASAYRMKTRLQTVIMLSLREVGWAHKVYAWQTVCCNV